MISDTLRAELQAFVEAHPDPCAINLNGQCIEHDPVAELVEAGGRLVVLTRACPVALARQLLDV